MPPIIQQQAPSFVVPGGPHLSPKLNEPSHYGSSLSGHASLPTRIPVSKQRALLIGGMVMSAILGIIGVTLLGLGAKGAVADQYTFTNPGITYTPFCNPYGSYCRPPEIVGRYTVTYGISDEHIGMLAGGGVLFALALILLGGTCVLRRKEKSNVINQNAHVGDPPMTARLKHIAKALSPPRMYEEMQRDCMTLFKILNVRLPMARSERVTLSIKKDLHTCEVCSAFGSDQKASALFHMPGGSDNMADDHEQSMRD